MRYLNVDTATKISKIGLGTWQFGSREWGYGKPYAEQEAQAIVRRAIELGVTLFDTAEIYGFGRSERILGQAIAGHRDEVFLATKILPIAPLPPIVEQRAVASADRLGVSRLDLYQVHQPNPFVRDSVIMRGMRPLQRIGLVGEVGVSNYSLNRWKAAEDALGSRVLSNQVSYSLVAHEPTDDLIPYAERSGRVVIAYSPLAQGFLSGRYDAFEPPGQPDPGGQRALPAGEHGAGRRAVPRAARGRRGARRHSRADGARLGDQKPGRHGHPRRVQRRAAGEQRGRRGDRPDRRRVAGTAGRGRPVPSGYRARRAAPAGPRPARPLTYARNAAARASAETVVRPAGRPAEAARNPIAGGPNKKPA